LTQEKVAAAGAAVESLHQDEQLEEGDDGQVEDGQSHQGDDPRLVPQAPQHDRVGRGAAKFWTA